MLKHGIIALVVMAQHHMGCENWVAMSSVHLSFQNLKPPPLPEYHIVMPHRSYLQILFYCITEN